MGRGRSFGAILRDIERAKRSANYHAARHERARARAQAEAVRAGQQIVAAEEAADYERFVLLLKSSHVSCAATVDWSECADESPPRAPVRDSSREDLARGALALFRPKWWRVFTGGNEKAQRVLEQELADATEAANQTFARAQNEHKEEIEAWAARVKLAFEVLRREPEALVRAFEERNELAGLAVMGSRLRLTYFGETSKFHAILAVHGKEVVPDERLSLTSTGKLSRKAMPKGEYADLWQDYVCSSTLRVGREFFAIVPLDELVVTAVDTVVDGATGNDALRPLLSLRLTRAEFLSLRFDRIDPSDAALGLGARMNFKKQVGFVEIEPLLPIDE